MFESVSTYTYAMYVSGLAPVWGLAHSVPGITIRLRTPADQHPLSGTFQVETDSKGRLDVWGSPLFGRFLSTLDDPIEAEVVLADGSDCHHLTLAGPWWTSSSGTHRVCWAGHVRPDDRWVASQVQGLGTLRRDLQTVASGLFGETADLAVAELSRRLQDEGSHAAFGFAERPATAPTADPPSAPARSDLQRVRPPHCFVHASKGAVDPASEAELGLVFASALEALGVSPVLLVLPTRLIVAYKRARSRSFRPILSDWTLVRDLVSRDVWRVVDPAAWRRGEDPYVYLPDSEGGFVVDVVAARPPDGSVAPLELARDPAVERGVLWAEARPVDRPKVETLHLLTGLIHAEAGLVTELLEAAGGDPRGWAQRLDPPETLSAERSSGPRRTINYKVTLAHAEEIAHSCYVSTVREVDVLWALLESASRRVHHELERMGCDRVRLGEQLRRFGAGPSRSTRLG